MPPLHSPDVAVVGGGAAGLLAAISAAEEGRRVLLLEKNPILGRKVLVSGNGRCNIANVGARVENFHGENNRLLHGVFARFGVDDTLKFFQDLGLILKEEKLGRLFPVSNQAASVVDLLEYRMRQLGVEIRCGCPVAGIVPEGPLLRIDLDGHPPVRCARVVVAPGGKSFPKLGTTGDGYGWAETLGHRVTALVPALVPMETDTTLTHRLQGVRLDAEVTGVSGSRALRKFRGDLLFTAYGLSGPTILAASADLAPRIGKRAASFQVNFLPGLGADEADAMLADRWKLDPTRGLAFSFTGWLPRKMAPAILESLGIESPTRPVSQVGRQTRRRIAEVLTGWRLEVKGCRSFDEAEVTAGGVASESIDPRTLQSRRVPGLYFCGEILDLFGDWGGYNFQLAWSTGWVAGKEAARR